MGNDEVFGARRRYIPGEREANRRAGADLALASPSPRRRRAAPGSLRGTRQTVPARLAGSSCGRAHSTHCTRTHSRFVGKVSRGAHGSTLRLTVGAILRPPPQRLVAISRALTSRSLRHGCDVTNGTSHGPPAACRPPEPALTASLVRSRAFVTPRRTP
ncbi:unnamed protein product [Pieris macdunnoughi]|uniref:Uncharacterized protein n=1 Tax=Pieris macdunnoughi TaxID=345717 RepID=A0A821LZS6_9NEOP|nr:unnamed protein product [Pieris macdunnoughi]